MGKRLLSSVKRYTKVIHLGFYMAGCPYKRIKDWYNHISNSMELKSTRNAVPVTIANDINIFLFSEVHEPEKSVLTTVHRPIALLSGQAKVSVWFLVPSSFVDIHCAPSGARGTDDVLLHPAVIVPRIADHLVMMDIRDHRGH